MRNWPVVSLPGSQRFFRFVMQAQDLAADRERRGAGIRHPDRPSPPDQKLHPLAFREFFHPGVTVGWRMCRTPAAIVKPLSRPRHERNGTARKP